MANRNAASITANRPHSGSTHPRQPGHSARATIASSRVSISIVAETEMPYAVASADEVRNASTRPMTITIIVQLMPGM